MRTSSATGALQLRFRYEDGVDDVVNIVLKTTCPT